MEGAFITSAKDLGSMHWPTGLFVYQSSESLKHTDKFARIFENSRPLVRLRTKMYIAWNLDPLFQTKVKDGVAYSSRIRKMGRYTMEFACDARPEQR